MRFFNTAGPVRPDDHYAVAPLDRVDLEELLGLIRAKQYFVLHAPRQTGKTSALIALRDLLNSGKVGNFRCVHINVEVAQVARDDTASGIRAILSMMAARALLLGDDFPRKSWNEILAASDPNDALRDVLMHWCLADPTPLVLLVGRDRFAGGRHPTVGAAPAPGRLRATPGGFPAERGAVRGARHPRLPHPVERRRGSSPAAARSTSPRSPFAWATSPRRRPAP